MKSFKLKNRALAALLCLFMVGGVVSSVFLNGSTEAEASGSLSGIVALKNANTEYNILEIVPDVTESAFSWYFGDSEPVNSRKLTSAYGSDMDNLVTKYQDATTMLQNQNYLLGSAVNGDVSQNILQYLGEVKLDGGSLTGGFQNNEWFQRYVLDWTEQEAMANIKVTVLAPQNVTLAHINLADMIVVSGGYYYPDSTVTPTAFSTDASSNLSTDVANGIISAEKQGLPVILDRRAYNVDGANSLASNRVFHEILGSDPRMMSSGVYGSTFYFSSVANGSENAYSIPLANGGTLGLTGNTAQGYLVTPQFNMAFDSSISGLNGPFGDVLASIQSENSSRNQFQDTLIPEEITMARVIQYLMCGSSSTSATESEDKEIVHVLSIQPGDASGVAAYHAQTHDVYNLAAPSEVPQVGLPTNGASAQADQVTWEQLESWTGVSRENINVVEMTVNEFIRDQDVVSVAYDLVYIGNDISAGSYGLYEENAQFNVFGQGLADVSDKTYFAPQGETNTRADYSYHALTTDVSITKYNELIEFVQAGRPVILAPYLSAALNWKTETTTPSDVSVDPNSNMYKLLEAISGQSCVMRQDILIAGADGVVGTGDDNNMIDYCVSLVHIPKATIEFATLSASMPDDYDQNKSYTYTGTASKELEYIFKISNETASTGGYYQVDLSLDLDGDGFYDLYCNDYDGFVVNRLETSLDGDLLLDGNLNPLVEMRVGENNLVEEQYYQVTFTLPDWVEGIVPWKLFVYSLDNSAISTMTLASTYTATEEPKAISILQVYGGNDYSIEESATWEALLKNKPVSNDATITVKSVTAEGLDKENLGDYNLVIIGDVVDDISSSSKSSLINYYQNSPILFSESTMTKDALPFYKGTFSSVEAVLSVSNSTLDLLNSDKFTSYPFEITLSNSQFVLAEDKVYYTNVGISEVGEDAKIIINTLAIAAEFSEIVEENSNDEGTITHVLDLWANASGDEKMIPQSLSFYTDVADKGTSVADSSPYIYFSLPVKAEAENCLFDVTVFKDDGLTLSGLSGFVLAEDTTETYVFGAKVDASKRYRLELTDDFVQSIDKETSIQLYIKAFGIDDNTSEASPLAANVVTISMISGKEVLDMFKDSYTYKDTTVSNQEVDVVVPGLFIPMG